MWFLAQFWLGLANLYNLVKLCPLYGQDVSSAVFHSDLLILRLGTILGSIEVGVSSHTKAECSRYAPIRYPRWQSWHYLKILTLYACE
jgi:hypothetical protein